MSTVGAGDTATNGTDIAEPVGPSGALFSNPAGLAVFDRTTAAGSFGVGFGQEQIRALGNPAYRPKRRILTTIPDAAVAVPADERLTLGAGVSGSVGTMFNFNPDPGAGVTADFFSEVTIVNLPLAASYRIGPRLWVGAELTPLFGYFRAHYPTPVVPVRFTLRGPGIQSMVGLTWRPAPDWSLGLGLRSPGMVWMRGSMPAPGAKRQDVRLDLEVPAQISLGVTKRFGRRLSVSVAGRWTDSSSLGRSDVEFEATPAIDTPFVPDALDEWRAAVGCRYRWSEALELRAGYAHATRIVGNRGISPLLFDAQDDRLGGGLAWTRGSWTVEAMVGYWFLRSRQVGPQEALILPGRYRFGGGGIVMLGLVHRI